MKNDDTKQMCLSLLHADTGEEVIRILSENGYWDKQEVWRFYGDEEDNFSTIGSQQSRPDAALVEKVTNSVDAVLMNECWLKGLKPDDPSSPKSIYEAVALFFFGNPEKHETMGHIAYWENRLRTEISKRITITATGSRSNPCFTITDNGEGQTPNSMPYTLLDLRHKNKLRVHFVQGKFNMGSTGVFQFCGNNNIQLIISKRNPKITEFSAPDSSSDKWGFTIIRREAPQKGRKTSVYTYLAPISADDNPCKGTILNFTADSLPIFPEGQAPYKRESNWGTVIKLYDYEATGFRTNMMLRDGLLSKLDVLLPEIALPVRLYECRDYKGHKGSFETTLCGLHVRLEDNKADNLEDGFPSSSPFTARGEPMTAKIFAFKKGRSETYRKNEGIIFTVNGQTHANLPTTFFHRKSIWMGSLSDSILVSVDCSNLSGRAREDLFMNSRDRLRGGDLREEIERELEIIIKEHQGLRELRERRKRQEIESKLSDSKPLEEALEKILKSSPSLAALLISGIRLPNPFKIKEVISSDKPFKGKLYPTFFKFRGIPYGDKLERTTAMNMRSRIVFETDVVNDYFDRLQNKGTFSLIVIKSDRTEEVKNFNLNLQNGVATLSLRHSDTCAVGDILEYEAKVSDDTSIEPFINRFAITVGPIQKIESRKSSRRKSAGDEKGNDRETAGGLALPDINKVYKSEWENRKHKFDEYSALEIVQEEASDKDDQSISTSDYYSFWINMDNIYLKTEMKGSKKEPEITQHQFIYGITLIGMALIKAFSNHEEESSGNTPEGTGGDTETTVEEHVYRTTQAIAPILLPLIETLGALTEDIIKIGSEVSDSE